MAILNSKTATDRETVTGFGGISDHAGLTSHAAADMRNFRILSDGTLEKRCGSLSRYAFSSPIRGLWEGTVGDESYLFVVAGNQIYMYSRIETSPRPVYVLTTSEGEVSFFLYCGRLYLMDGESLLYYHPTKRYFSLASGYVPLYGYNWHPTAMGEVNEPINLIRNDIRIHYFNSNGSTTFQLPFTADRVRRVAINGTPITTYTFTPGTNTFTIPSGQSGVGSVEVYVTRSSIYETRKSVLRACHGAVYRTPQREVVMSFGADAGYLVYRTTPVSEEALDACNLAVGDADFFYIAADSAFAVGSIAHPVTALCQFEDRMLALSDESIWAISYPDASSNDADIFPIRAGLGCSSRGGVTLCGKYPVAVTPAGIARLKFSSSDPDYCEAEILSVDLRERFDEQFLKNAILFWDTSRQELWVRDPSDSAGTVWICDPERSVWFRFDGIHADDLFSLEGKISFTKGEEIFYLDESLETDNGVAFSAEYRSHNLAFASPHTPKRSIRLSLIAENGGDGLSTRIRTERGEKELPLPSQSAPNTPVFYDRRLAMGRFRLLQFSITSEGVSRCRILSYSIAANQ